jgi:hypothetical protein|tara:strand:+ start:49 stop:387 length:339 start_codon:yes stop_codon:yes gene_type:complete
MKKELILFLVFMLLSIIPLVTSVDSGDQNIIKVISNEISGENSSTEDLPFGSELFTKEPYLAVLKNKKSLSWLLLVYLLIILAFVWFLVIRKRKKMLGDARSEMKVKLSMRG